MIGWKHVRLSSGVPAIADRTRASIAMTASRVIWRMGGGEERRCSGQMANRGRGVALESTAAWVYGKHQSGQREKNLVIQDGSRDAGPATSSA